MYIVIHLLLLHLDLHVFEQLCMRLPKGHFLDTSKVRKHKKHLGR